MTYIEFVNQKKSPHHPTPLLNVSVGEVHFAPSLILQPINSAKHSQPLNHSTLYLKPETRAPGSLKLETLRFAPET